MTGPSIDPETVSAKLDRILALLDIINGNTSAAPLSSTTAAASAAATVRPSAATVTCSHPLLPVKAMKGSVTIDAAGQANVAAPADGAVQRYVLPHRSAKPKAKAVAAAAASASTASKSSPATESALEALAMDKQIRALSLAPLEEDAASSKLLPYLDVSDDGIRNRGEVLTTAAKAIGSRRLQCCQPTTRLHRPPWSPPSICVAVPLFSYDSSMPSSVFISFQPPVDNKDWGPFLLRMYTLRAAATAAI